MPLTLVADLASHTDRVWCVSWHPTRPVLASASSDRTVQIHAPTDPTKPSTLRTMQKLADGHTRTVRSVCWTPDGRRLASAGFDGQAVIWERSDPSNPTGSDFEVAATLEGHENEVKCVAINRSGSLLATCGRDKSVWVWEWVKDTTSATTSMRGDILDDEVEFECLAVMQDHQGDVKYVAWHPTEDILISCGYDDAIRVWEEHEDDFICRQVISCDTVVLPADHTNKGWVEESVTPSHKSTVWAVDFDSTGNRFASVGDDKTVRFWRRSQPETSMATSTEPTSLSSSVYAALRRAPEWMPESVLTNVHSRPIYSVSWSKQHGLLATAGGDDTVRVFQEAPSADGSTMWNQIGETRLNPGIEPNCVRWCESASGQWLLAVGADDGHVRVLRLDLNEARDVDMADG